MNKVSFLKASLLASAVVFSIGAYAGPSDYCGEGYIHSVEPNAGAQNLIQIRTTSDIAGKNILTRYKFYMNNNSDQARAFLSVVNNAMNMRYPMKFYCMNGDKMQLNNILSVVPAGRPV